MPLARVSQYMNLSKTKILTNAFFDVHFKYCPLIWMCHSRINNRKINRLHQRYGCSFVAKLSWKKNFFLKKCFLQNIHYLQKKKFYMEKKVLYWKFFLLKKTFFTEKNINENVKNIYLIWKIFLYRKCLFYKILFYKQNINLS